MIEIKSELDPSKKVVITGAYAINSEYKSKAVILMEWICNL
jgi:hypothetical protein